MNSNVHIISEKITPGSLTHTHNHRSIYQAGVTTNNRYKITLVYYIITGTQMW